ncbi:hypothetical protein ACYSNR_11520 [Enterococcus sp. LJL128]|uniref:hypothetical protein n=1 Tax=Enterococcus sp. LJL51 TaxID=3416656 RepID=UPI003CF466EC
MKIVGEWVNKMNEYQNERSVTQEKKGFFERIKIKFVPIKKVVENNWLIFVVSTIIAIPLFIMFYYIIANIANNITNHEEIKSGLQISGLLLAIPILCLDAYFMYKASIKKMPILTIFFIIFVIGIAMLNILAGLDFIEIVKTKEEDLSGLFFLVFLLDVYTISFMLTKLVCLIFDKIIDKIKKVKNWIVDEGENNNDILKAKLSFINKIITGFIAIVASILGLLLTLNQIL